MPQHSPVHHWRDLRQSQLSDFAVTPVRLSDHCRPRKIACLCRLVQTALICAIMFPWTASGQIAPLHCADLSSLDEVEAGLAVFRDANGPGDALAILKAQGLETIRLRLFHAPDELRDSLDDVKSLARRAHDLGYRILLNLHYSDTWADPAHQTKPAAWEGLPIEALRDSVYAHTAGALAALDAQGTPPDIVQIGNEISTGMLWDTGRVGGAFDIPAQWEAFSSLLAAGIAAVRETGSSRIMIHNDRGGDPSGAQWFFDRLTPFALDYDFIGLSYYPFWHGPLDNLRQTVRLLNARYQKPVLIIETAYPWTLLWNDNQHNQVGLPSHVLPGFPATPEGQADFLAALWSIAPAGVCYWSGELISAPLRSSSWENLALFDFDGRVLPAARALGSGPTSVHTDEEWDRERLEVYPNPVPAGHVTLTLRKLGANCVEARVFDVLGRLRHVAEGVCRRHHPLSGLWLTAGAYWISVPGLRSVSFVVIP